MRRIILFFALFPSLTISTLAVEQPGRMAPSSSQKSTLEAVSALAALGHSREVPRRKSLSRSRSNIEQLISRSDSEMVGWEPVQPLDDDVALNDKDARDGQRRQRRSAHHQFFSPAGIAGHHGFRSVGFGFGGGGFGFRRPFFRAPGNTVVFVNQQFFPVGGCRPVGSVAPVTFVPLRPPRTILRTGVQNPFSLQSMPALHEESVWQHANVVVGAVQQSAAHPSGLPVISGR